MPSRFHRAIGRPAKDTPRDIRDRILRRESGERANQDTRAKFGTLTAENAREAMEYQAMRMDAIFRELWSKETL